MDYGHTNPQDSTKDQAFFTTGVGNAPASENAPDQIDDLNTDQDSWGYTPEHSPAAIGNKIIASTEAPDFNSKVIPPQPEFGQIIATSPASLPPLEGVQAIYDKSAIRAEGDRIGKSAINEIRKIEDKLSQDSDLNSFYERARELTTVNLKNSYNRELGERN